ncbi:MAG: NERD domain-containing protein, partial [Desulfobulbaceae bacterium]|nr:NERD domain-containing protein [Desulfobulbaceae bacterium]
GYDCELAVGQDLNELIGKGFKIYHDFPADGFNIDHIAIGPTGVFAIETKGRSKHVNAEKDNWKLTFDGMILLFPGWSESKPIKQAIDQARWLNLWLSSATGEPQKVTPVLAIPGWYVNRIKPSMLIIYNGKKSEFLANGTKVLSEKRIKAISHQVENKCRDVENTSYRKD